MGNAAASSALFRARIEASCPSKAATAVRIRIGLWAMSHPLESRENNRKTNVFRCTGKCSGEKGLEDATSFHEALSDCSCSAPSKLAVRKDAYAFPIIIMILAKTAGHTSVHFYWEYYAEERLLLGSASVADEVLYEMGCGKENPAIFREDGVIQ
jgi:hypothetical protein